MKVVSCQTEYISHHRSNEDDCLEALKRIHNEQMEVARIENQRLKQLLSEQSSKVKPVILDCNLQVELEKYKNKYRHLLKEIEVKDAEFAVKLDCINEEKRSLVNRLEDQVDKERDLARSDIR